MNAYFFFLNSEIRRAVVRGELRCPGANYVLYGADLLPKRGIGVQHNLQAEAPPSIWAFRVAWLISRGIALIGGSDGDFQSVIQERRRANHADIILSTVDNVGVPLAFLNAFGLIRRPLVYVSIGLPERMQSIRSTLTRTFYRALYRRIPTFVTYGWEEAVALRHWLGLPAESSRVVFIPFGVDHLAFKPMPDIIPEVDVLAVGADMMRDFGLLLDTARSKPSVSFRIITSPRLAASFGELPQNVHVLTNVPFPEIRRHLAAARLVVLPCHQNTYSSGTTTLLQSLSMAKPVVVTRTGAISQGYQLEDNVNCRLVSPGSLPELSTAIQTLVDDPSTRTRLGATARKTVEQHLTWDLYVERMARIIKPL